MNTYKQNILAIMHGLRVSRLDAEEIYAISEGKSDGDIIEKKDEHARPDSYVVFFEKGDECGAGPPFEQGNDCAKGDGTEKPSTDKPSPSPYGKSKAKFNKRESGKQAEIKQASINIFGKPVKIPELMSIAGSPDDSDVSIETLGEDKQSMIAIHTNDMTIGLRSVVVLSLNAKGEKVIEDSLVKIKEPKARGRGVGLELFGRQVENAIEHGFSEIQLYAARVDDEDPKLAMNGYYVWPKYGLDGEIPERAARALPDNLKSAKTIQQLYMLEGGEAWWKEHGVGTEMTFSLKEGSLGRRIWEAYRAKKEAQRASEGSTPGQSAFQTTRSSIQSGRISAKNNPETHSKGEECGSGPPFERGNDCAKGDGRSLIRGILKSYDPDQDIRNYISKNKLPGGSVFKQGMRRPEHMQKLKVSGVTFRFPRTGDDSHINESLKQFASWKLPRRLTSNLKSVIFSQQPNKRDAELAKKHGLEEFETYATATQNTIVFYNNNPITKEYLAHESAHTLAYKLWNHTTPPEDSDYADAMEEGPAPTAYGQTSPAEDFAESCMLWATRGKDEQGRLFRDHYPKRAEVIRRIMTDENYRG